jgi:hypothetical protein
MRGEATGDERREMMEEGNEKASILKASIVSDRPSSIVVLYDGYFEKSF